REAIFRAGLVGLVLLAAAVREFRSRPIPDDRDELFQLKVVQAPAQQFWRELRKDAVHPPLDYLVDRAALAVSPRALALRLPVVLWASLTVGALGLLIRRRCGRTSGLAAAAFLALAPYHVAESCRLRPYPLAVLFLVAALLVLDRLLSRPSVLSALLY